MAVNPAIEELLQNNYIPILPKEPYQPAKLEDICEHFVLGYTKDVKGALEVIRMIKVLSDRPKKDEESGDEDPYE